MTFDNIVTEICDRAGLNSSSATTRIGKAVNRAYRRVTTAINLATSRRTTITQAKSLGSAEVTFSGIEKIERIIDDTSGSVRVLREVTYASLKDRDAGTGEPTEYAIKSMGAAGVTVRLDVLAQDTGNLKADGWAELSDLSGSNEPAFPESFHDVLIEAVLAEELRKQEKPALAKIAMSEFERILSDLKFFIAKSGYLTNRQGQTRELSLGTGANGSGGAPSGGTSYTQTGLVTFDRDPAAPFAVTSGSAKVDNLDADKLDGLDAADFALDGDVAAVAADLAAHEADTANPHAVTKTQVGLGNVPNTDATNASNLSSGTVPDARFPATLPAISGANLTNLDASDLASGTVPDARFPSTLPAVSGANLTNLNATNLASGTVDLARLPSIVTTTTAVGNSNFSTTSSSLQDITGLSVSPTVIAGSALLIMVRVPLSLSGNNANFALSIGGVDTAILVQDAITSQHGVDFFYVHTGHSAGSLEIKARVRNNDGAATVTINMSGVANGQLAVFEIRKP